ncbi:MAG: sugar kinase [Clostridia bacterium]
MNIFKENKDFDMISFGEVMLRLSPPHKEKISHGQTFEKNAGGSELNVAAGVAYLGGRSAIVTKLPDNKVGRFIKYKIRYSNVSDDFVLADYSDEQRLGVYFYETGAYPRKSAVVYDRANSSMNSINIDEIDPSIYQSTRLFHVSGVSLALAGNIRNTSIELIKKFKENGTAISFDVNYRASLWGEEEAKETILSILPYVDILFISEETSRKMMGRTGTMDEIMKQYADEYGCKVVLTTKREVISPTKHNFGSTIYCDGKYYSEEHYKNIEIVDRLGSGDAYVGGALFGLLQYGDPQKALEFGNAMGAVKNTIYGDLPVCSFEEVESIIKSHKNTGSEQEMNR